jgi:hypothetical protein
MRVPSKITALDTQLDSGYRIRQFMAVGRDFYYNYSVKIGVVKMEKAGKSQTPAILTASSTQIVTSKYRCLPASQALHPQWRIH